MLSSVGSTEGAAAPVTCSSGAGATLAKPHRVQCSAQNRPLLRTQPMLGLLQESRNPEAAERGGMSGREMMPRPALLEHIDRWLSQCTFMVKLAKISTQQLHL